MNNNFYCPHFSICSGCELDLPALYHPPVWEEALRFFEGLSPNLYTDGFDQTRWKAKLAVRPGSERPGRPNYLSGCGASPPFQGEAFQIGLFKRATHDVISIPHCKVHHPLINEAVAVIKENLTIPPYRENPPSGLLRYIQLFAGQKVQLVLVVNSDRITAELEHFCNRLLKQDIWHSIWLNFHPAISNRVLGDRWQLVSGEPFLWQTINAIPIAFHPGAFSQAHLPLFERMIQKITAWVQPCKRILELYAGVGAISLSLGAQADQIHLVENNPFAHLSWKETLTKVSHPNRFQYHCIDAKESLSLVEVADCILVDPPRKGLDPLILQKICERRCGRLIYVSCGFTSFQRDTAQLLSSGWALRQADGYLLFPGTNHVEILALFEKS